MSSHHDPFHTRRQLSHGHYYSLVAFAERGFPQTLRLPISLRLILESLIRNCDGQRVKESDVIRLAQWHPTSPTEEDVPFVVSRVLLQDFTGVPLLVDLAAMRDAVAARGLSPRCVEPLVPVDLVIDHSIQVDRARTDDAFSFNLKVELERNRERYTFLKWGQQAFNTLRVVPPAIGIVHQVNLEYLATVVTAQPQKEGVLLFPDTLVGTDSHTPMINGLGVVGWGVGGIEAEAAMLGQPVSLKTPAVVGVHLTGKLREGVTATDLALHLTELLRRAHVVDQFVEFFGPGTASLTVADRATIGNMAPEYGATMGFFPADEATLEYLRMTGRSEEAVACVKDYLQAQHCFGIPQRGEIDFSRELELDLSTVSPCVSGPKRPQDRISLPDVSSRFRQLLTASPAMGGYGQHIDNPSPRICLNETGHFPLPHETGGIEELGSSTRRRRWSEEEMVTNRPFTRALTTPGYSDHLSCNTVLTHGSIVIAAITSCTNTSNPSVMIAAGLLAKKAVARGLQVHPLIKTSLAPGSRVVTDYLIRAGLQEALDQLGFQLVGYGCTTCIGNSGPLDERIEEAIKTHDLIVASVLSGNRNFEARIHSSVKANFLMSPPLVVAFALAGRVDIDLERMPLSYDSQGEPVFLRDVWPTQEEINVAMAKAVQAEMFTHRYQHIMEDNPSWQMLPSHAGAQYAWDPLSTYICSPPYFESPSSFSSLETPLPHHMRLLALFGDSVTTDHISPAGAFHPQSPAGQYLISQGVTEEEFNSYGSRRGNHHLMMRGTFANVRLRNQLVGEKEGGYTLLFPEGTLMTLFDACEVYRSRATPLLIIAGKDYGMGSSRDWAAKGPALLGVKVVLAQSFERIHRSNLIGMGILPLQFESDDSPSTLQLTGQELFSLEGTTGQLKPKQPLSLTIVYPNGTIHRLPVICRLDTPLEVTYYQYGGILPFVFSQLIMKK